MAYDHTDWRPQSEDTFHSSFVNASNIYDLSTGYGQMLEEEELGRKFADMQTWNPNSEGLSLWSIILMFLLGTLGAVGLSIAF